MDTKTHWDKIYKTKAPEAVSWYRPHLETSLGLIERAAGDIQHPSSMLAAANPHSSTTSSNGDTATLLFLMYLKPPLT